MRWIANVCIVLMCVVHTAWGAPEPFTVCSGYECSRSDTLTLSDGQWREIRVLFTPAASAREERVSIRRAIARMEQMVGERNGTSADLGGNVAGGGMPGQMDCIDESRNTTTYLELLRQDGLLRRHEVRERAQRGKWVIDVHWTAVIRDTDSGQLYAVDSWFLDNGEEPYIQKLEDWLDKKDFAKQDE